MKICGFCGSRNGDLNKKCVLCSRRLPPKPIEPEEEFFDGPVEFEQDEDFFGDMNDDYEEED